MATHLEMLKEQISADKIVITSEFFLVETHVSIEKQHLVLYTMLERSTNEGKITVDIIWQSKGLSE